MPGPSGISTKALGLIAAGFLTLVFIIIIFVSMNQTPAPTKGTRDFFPDDDTEIPNIGDTQTGGAMLVTMVDKNDPTRVAGTLKADRFEPIGERRRRLDRPVSWIYMKDGRAIKVTADYATMLMPDPNQPPDSGTLEGNILIQAFESDDDTQEPILVARFDEPVEFERRYLRLRSPGRFEINSDQFDFSGAELTVILNELRDRVELIDVGRGDQIVIHTAAANKAGPSANQTAPAPGPVTEPEPQAVAANSPDTIEEPAIEPAPAIAQAADEQATDPIRAVETPVEDAAVASNEPATTTPSPSEAIADLFTRYHITLDDQVVTRINQRGSGAGHATSDRLELWLALEGGALPSDAIRDITFAKNAEPEQAARLERAQLERFTPSALSLTSLLIQDTGLPTTTPDPIVIRDGNVDASDDASEDIVITWAGKMSVRPIDGDLPPQLVNDHLTLELLADEGSRVRFEVPEQGFVGESFAASYHATRGVVSLVGTDADEINLAAEGSGSLFARSLGADLATGRITLDGPGRIVSTPDGDTDPAAIASINWTKNAGFDLAMTDEGLSDRLTAARFNGTVEGSQGESSFAGDVVDAKFDPNLESSRSLTHLHMVNGRLASAGDENMLAGDTLDIDFAPSTGSGQGSIEPTKLVAEGKVNAKTIDSTLETEHLIAYMHRDLEDQLSVRTAQARENIRYTGPNRSSARGDSLDLDGASETMTLLGAPARLAQGGSKVTGNHIDLDAKRRSIDVLGPGSFDHDIIIEATPTSVASTGHIRATWKGSMRFDDAIGSIVCEEQVHVISTPDAYTLDTLDAHRATIKLTAKPAEDRITAPNANPLAIAQDDSSRELISARIFGHAPAGKAPVPAKIESRSFAADDPELVVGLIFLEGPQILVDNQAQTLDVPAPGTLLVMDREQQDEQVNQGQNQNQDRANTGEITGFTWQGDMHLNRALGTARIRKQVQVRQENIATGNEVALNTDQLDARFDIGQSGAITDGIQSQGTRLLGADAIGSVRFRYEGRELLADTTSYDAISNSLFASAVGSKLVTLYDDTQPGPMSAKTMRWDLEKDRIEINAPTPSRTFGQPTD
tara:strand:- start:47534 stop:50782 length:3249 start_codon:yes stop_codon:yes gene_type:complete